MGCHCHGCDHCHEGEHHHHHEEESPAVLYRAGAAAVLMAAGLLISFPLNKVLFAAAYLIAGYDVLLGAAKNIAGGHLFDEQFLMAVASLGAMLMGEYAEGIAVLALYQVGEWLQDRAVDKSRDSIAQLMDIRPDRAYRLVDGQPVQVSPQQVAVGDMILVRPGEKIPLDGRVTEGVSALNTVALTGESLPRDVQPGDEVLSGSVNLTGVLTIQVTAAYGESTVAKILRLMEESSEHQAGTEKFITRFARIYTPVVCLAALLLAVIPSLVDGQWGQWVHRALTFLVISCPCALVISVPLTFFSGMGGASRKGILLKGAQHMEALSRVDTMVFDKTGTLTRGSFTVTEIKPSGVSGEKLLELAALAESSTTHPIGLSILAAWGKPVDRQRLSQVEEVAGQGIIAMVDGQRIHAGNLRLMTSAGVEAPMVEAPGTVVHVAADGVYLGCLVIADEVKPSAASALARLKELGVSRLVMLTGDRRRAAEHVARQLGVTEAHAELLPGDKVAHLKEMTGKSTVAFVGDGINDAPVLRCADVGIAMGGVGSDAAIEAADVVLMDDDLTKLPQAICHARKTMSIAWQNIAFALCVKLAVMVLGILGVTPMWVAVFADVGVCMLAILNAMRAMK